MTKRRYYVCDGAKTTADGVVKASSAFSSLNGRPLAREGDPVECPACGQQGVIECAGPRLSDLSEGKECALSDDLCRCACSPPPTLVADQFDDFQVVADSSAA